MAAVYNLETALAQANQPAVSSVPPPPPVSAATPNPVASPDDQSQFQRLLSAVGSMGRTDTPEKAAQMQAQGAAADAQPSGYDYIKNFFGGNKGTDADLAARQNVANVVAHPIAQKIIGSDPSIGNLLATDPVGTASKLQDLIAAAGGAPPTTATHTTPAGTLVKIVPDPAKLAAVAHIAGAHPNDMNPFVNHNDYTDDEFVAATQHLNWKQAARMFGAAQRLTPQQQITNHYAGILNDNAARAEQAYNEAVTGKKPKGTQDKLQAAKDAANGEARAFLKKISEGQQSIFPDSAIQ